MLRPASKIQHVSKLIVHFSYQISKYEHSASLLQLFAKPDCLLAKAQCDRPCETLVNEWLYTQGLYLHLASSESPN